MAAAPIRLVDARFFVNLAKEAGGRLVRRQDLPESAFIPLERIKNMPKGYMKDLRILCVSHPWLTPDHPDPRGDSLRTLARVLDQFCRDRFDGGTWAVFVDFCSLPQCGPAGAARTPAEATLLSRGLASLAQLYSHPSTWTLKLTRLPGDDDDWATVADCPPGCTPNRAPYEQRGWCWTEAAVSNLVKPYTQVLDLGNYTGTAPLLPDLIRECRSGRGAPLTPPAFDALLETKSFTWRDADLPTVRALYASAFRERFARASQLTYLDLGWTDADVTQLCKVIAAGALRHVAGLSLVGNRISDAGMAELATCLGHEEAAPRLVLSEGDLFGNVASAAACAHVLACLAAAQRRAKERQDASGQADD